MSSSYTNATMGKFGHPATLIREWEHWVMLLRPAQVTLGSVVVAAKSDVGAFADLPSAAFTELADVVPAVEQVVKSMSDYERINWLMLMMVDPHVHLHVLPRYDGTREWQGVSFPDAGWPGPPALGQAVDLDAEQIAALVEAMQAA